MRKGFLSYICFPYCRLYFQSLVSLFSVPLSLIKRQMMFLFISLSKLYCFWIKVSYWSSVFLAIGGILTGFSQRRVSNWSSPFMPNSLLSPLAKLSRWRSIAINCFHQKPDFLHPVRGTRVCLASFSCDVSCEKHGEVIFPGWHNRLYLRIVSCLL